MSAPRSAHVEAEHPDLAGVGLAEALEDLDGRRLAGAVRAEQAEDLARADLEADAVNRLDLAIVLLQVAYTDDRVGGTGAFVMHRWSQRSVASARLSGPVATGIGWSEPQAPRTPGARIQMGEGHFNRDGKAFHYWDKEKEIQRSARAATAPMACLNI